MNTTVIEIVSRYSQQKLDLIQSSQSLDVIEQELLDIAERERKEVEDCLHKQITERITIKKEQDFGAIVAMMQNTWSDYKFIFEKLYSQIQLVSTMSYAASGFFLHENLLLDSGSWLDGQGYMKIFSIENAHSLAIKSLATKPQRDEFFSENYQKVTYHAPRKEFIGYFKESRERDPSPSFYFKEFDNNEICSGEILNNTLTTSQKLVLIEQLKQFLDLFGMFPLLTSILQVYQ